ncbi:MAG: chorismate mutase [Patescibacteria group bacterium]
MNSKPLIQLRREIDAIDRAIIQLWAKRVDIARAIGMRKRVAMLPLKDEQRERRVVARAVLLGGNLRLPLSKVRALMNIIIATSRRAQKQ